MSAVYESNNNNNFEPAARYRSAPQHPPYYATRPYPQSAPRGGYATAPAAFSFHHHAAPAPSYNEQYAPMPNPYHHYDAALPPAAAPIPVLAERYKTKFCKNFVQTHHCPYEERCMFAHGEEELRSVHDNVRDGLVTEEAIKNFQRQWRHAILYGEATAVPIPEMDMQPHHYVDDGEESASSTTTMPKVVQAARQGGFYLPEAAVPVKEFLTTTTYRYNPYGTVSASAMGCSRCSSVDDFSSIAGDDEDYYNYEESTPQKRPMSSVL